eukprot:TRINITY_DN3534_c0_g1_i2.p4 TRINITY_DN3534_c0_g1~~TRINITY_DN3534_c0_g1_i2.p4  ORF type:complete len:119 (+),score=10.37 TRINITY_DN3534_c0_g1_i2:3-359(+)
MGLQQQQKAQEREIAAQNAAAQSRMGSQAQNSTTTQQRVAKSGSGITSSQTSSGKTAVGYKKQTTTGTGTGYTTSGSGAMFGSNARPQTQNGNAGIYGNYNTSYKMGTSTNNFITKKK